MNRLIKKILRENFYENLCNQSKKMIDSIYEFEDNRYPTFYKKMTDEGGNYSLVIELRKKDDYWDLYDDMVDTIINMYGVEEDEISECVEDHLDGILENVDISYLFGDNEEMLDEAEEGGGESSSSGGGESQSSGGSQWESGVSRGPANPIAQDSVWAGQRGWEGIKSYGTKRGVANKLS